MKKTKLIGLAALLLTLGVVGCGEGGEEGGDDGWKNDKTNHWHEVANEDGSTGQIDKAKHTLVEDASKAVAPTCTAKGSKTEVCSVCGYEKVSEVAAAGHKYVEQTSESTAATCASAGTKVEKCSVCNDVKETEVKKLDHVMEANSDTGDHQNKTATCSEAGYHWTKCKNCTFWEKVDDGFAAHAWGAAETVSTAVASTTSGVVKKECSTCHAIDLVVDAMSYTELSGAIKSGGPASSLKLSDNDDNTTYKFSLAKAFTGKIYIMGCVDYWKDGSNNNDQRTFKSRKSGEGYNLEVTVNTTKVAITNEKTYEKMGMAEGEKVGSVQYSTYALCELGEASLIAGENVINYKRIESYNLNITEIHFIGKFAA